MTSGKAHVLYVGITCGLSAPYVAGQLDLCVEHLDRFVPVLIGFNPVDAARSYIPAAIVCFVYSNCEKNYSCGGRVEFVAVESVQSYCDVYHCVLELGILRKIKSCWNFCMFSYILFMACVCQSFVCSSEVFLLALINYIY